MKRHYPTLREFRPYLEHPGGSDKTVDGLPVQHLIQDPTDLYVPISGVSLRVKRDCHTQVLQLAMVYDLPVDP